MIKQKEKYRQFKKWQHQPHEVAPLAEEMHECATCGTHFEGNYCPRCGQSAQIGRYSFKKAFLLYLYHQYAPYLWHILHVSVAQRDS